MGTSVSHTTADVSLAGTVLVTKMSSDSENANMTPNRRKHKTTITVAHRLTTLKNSDRILVFDKGEIVQEGKFVDLSKKSGLFQDFLKQKVEIK